MKKFHLDPEKYHCKHSNKIVSEILPTSYGLLYIRLPIRFFCCTALVILTDWASIPFDLITMPSEDNALIFFSILTVFNFTGKKNCQTHVICRKISLTHVQYMLIPLPRQNVIQSLTTSQNMGNGCKLMSSDSIKLINLRKFESTMIHVCNVLSHWEIFYLLPLIWGKKTGLCVWVCVCLLLQASQWEIPF